jgi:branched-chain amino acid transport system permease protein
MSSADDVTNARSPGVLLRLWPLVALLAIVAAIAVCASFAPIVLQRRATQGLINLIAVVGLYVFVGNSGVLSFGNVAFMAVGAYVSALLTMKPSAKAVFLPELPGLIAHAQWPSLAGALAGGGAAAVVAFLVGLPLMRLSGVSASIATFAVLVVVYIVLGNWTAVTGGQNSLMGLPHSAGRSARSSSPSPIRRPARPCNCVRHARMRRRRRQPAWMWCATG